MKMGLQEAFDAGFDAVKAYIDSTLAELERRIAALEQKSGADLDADKLARVFSEELNRAA